MLYDNQILCGDALDMLRTMPDETVDMCLTSPPYYGLRDYGMQGQLGQEATPQQYIDRLRLIFTEVHRVLKPSGTLWLNIGDSYAGSMQGAGTKAPSAKQHSNRGTQYMLESSHKSPLRKLEGYKSKDMLGIPWHLAFSLREDGWYLRQDIIWYRANCMPESVRDRCTKSYEHIFLLSKAPKYYFDCDAIREPCTESSVADFKRRKTLGNKGGGHGSFEDVRPDLCRSRSDYYASDFKRHARDVWIINTKPFRGAHFATFPEALAERCILAGCPPKGIVLDPFMGSGTTAVTARRLGRSYIGVDLNPEYIVLAQTRIAEWSDTP